MDEISKYSIGSRVKDARLKNGMTQAELAEAVDKAIESISNIERGKAVPSISTLSEIAAALGVPMKDFFEIDLDKVDGARDKLVVQLNTVTTSMDAKSLEILLTIADALRAQQSKD